MDPQDDHWLARPGTIRLLWRLFIAVLVLLVAAGLMVAPEGHFGLDGWPGFAAGFGFLSCVVLVAGSKALGWLLKRPDDYYDE